MNLRKVDTKTFGMISLGVAILPQEIVRLHVYQPEFKSLVNDCFAKGTEFVVPVKGSGTKYTFGTLVSLADVERFYPDGKMDIKVVGKQLVHIKSVTQNANKLYAEGNVDLLVHAIAEKYKSEILELFKEISSALSISVDSASELTIFDIVKILELTPSEKNKIFQSAGSQKNLTITVLNELRLKALSIRMESAKDFRYYMN